MYLYTSIYQIHLVTHFHLVVHFCYGTTCVEKKKPYSNPNFFCALFFLQNKLQINKDKKNLYDQLSTQKTHFSKYIFLQYRIFYFFFKEPCSGHNTAIVISIKMQNKIMTKKLTNLEEKILKSIKASLSTSENNKIRKLKQLNCQAPNFFKKTVSRHLNDSDVQLQRHWLPRFNYYFNNYFMALKNPAF